MDKNLFVFNSGTVSLDEVCTVKQAAKELDKSLPTIYTYITKGWLETIEIEDADGLTLIRKADVLKLKGKLLR